MNPRVKRYIENHIDMLEKGDLREFLTDSIWVLDEADTQDMYNVLVAADVPNISKIVDDILYDMCKSDLTDLDGEVILNIFAKYLIYFKPLDECKEILRQAVEESPKFKLEFKRDGKEYIVPVH